MIQSDSSEQLLILRDNFLNLKYEVDQITSADIYPVTVWKSNFIFKVKKIVT